MPLVGTLSTMPLPDLLQWLATAAKTGTLQVERRKLTKWIQIESGRLIGCSSDDPPQLLGQYLISRELITEAQLRTGLTKQRETGQHLGITLVELGLLSPEELARHLEAKAEETIYSLFDWSDGVFRFEEGLPPRDNIFPVNLSVQDVLLRGLKRYDEMQRIHKVFDDPGIVLRYTERPPSPEIFSNKMARAMYATIDGDRSIADVLLHVRGSEYVVYKFLYDLYCGGYVEIADRKPFEVPEVPVPAPVAAPARRVPDLSPGRLPDPSGSAPAAGGRVALAELPSLELDLDPQSIVVPQAASAATAGDLTARVDEVRRLMASAQLEQAIDLADRLYRESPQREDLKRLLAEAEEVFVDRAYRHFVPAEKVPVLTRPVDQLATDGLSSHDFFLLSRIDGVWDIRSIIQIAPLREVDALRTLKRMRELGMIKLRDPQ